MVEHRLAKAGVAGSNPVSRFSYFGGILKALRRFPTILRRHTQVVKGAVCKIAILRFESGCRLQMLAGVAELVDAWDLKSHGSLLPCRFESGPRHSV